MFRSKGDNIEKDNNT